MSRKILTVGLLGLLLLFGCDKNDTPQNVIGLRPVYGDINDVASFIKTSAPRDLEAVGKIYHYHDLLFVNEKGKGIHVFDNSDPSAPRPTKFVEIPGNIDIAIKGDYLYADLGTGLVTLDISNLDSVQFMHFNNDYIQENSEFAPPPDLISSFQSGKVYFECPDTQKGDIIAWVIEEMPKPQCYINN